MFKSVSELLFLPFTQIVVIEFFSFKFLSSPNDVSFTEGNFSSCFNLFPENSTYSHRCILNAGGSRKFTAASGDENVEVAGAA